MFLEAVLQDHSLDSKGFTYFVPEHLRSDVCRGCVVEVPFGESLDFAVVTEIDSPPPERGEAKSIVSVAVAGPVLHSYQIEAAYDLCRRYFVFFHTAVSFFLPVPVLRRFIKRGKGYDVVEEGKSDFLSSRPVVFYDRDGIGAAKIFGKTIPAEPGTALILPSDAAVEAFLKSTALNPDDFLVHSDSLAEAADFRLRLSVAVRDRPFLVWSRKLCSYNLSAYPRLSYFEDALFSEARHKFFHSYDHLFLLESFVNRFGFSLSVSSFVPSCRIMASVAKGTWHLENVPSDENPT